MSSPPPVPADMAAVMGFSTFGDATAGNRPSKRARRDFTVVDCPSDQAALSKKARVGVQQQQQQNEDGQSGAAYGERPAGLPAKPPPPQDFGGSAAWRGAQRGGHGGRGRGQNGFAGARGGRQQGQHQQHQNQRHSHNQQNQNAHRQHGQKGKGAPRNELWYVEYYDPMCNENPWEALEQKAGLAARGSWLARGHGYENQGRTAETADEAKQLDENVSESRDLDDVESKDQDNVASKEPETSHDIKEGEEEGEQENWKEQEIATVDVVKSA